MPGIRCVRSRCGRRSSNDLERRCVATAGNMVFQGAADGCSRPMTPLPGGRLWRFNAGMGIVAAPISYSAGGKQYISVLVGYGGRRPLGRPHECGLEIRRPASPAVDLRPRRQGGAAALRHRRDMTVKAVDDPSIQIDPADVAAGHALFLACAACHGRNLVRPARRGLTCANPISPTQDGFWSLLHDGTLIEHGCRASTASRETRAAALRLYPAGAREVLNPRR